MSPFYRILKLPLFASFALALQSCALPPSSSDIFYPSPQTEPEAASTKVKLTKPVYLRGIFTWWEASPDYRLMPVSGHPNTWSTKADLIADGKSYEWKFGDSNWSCGFNFGPSRSTDNQITVDQIRDASACSKASNFKFIPPQDGTYEFFLDWSARQPVVYIKQAS